MDAQKREAITKEEAPTASLSGAGVQTEENKTTLITEEKSNDTAGIATPDTEDKSNDTAGIATPDTEDKSNDTAGIATPDTEDKSSDSADIGTSNTEDKTYHPESSTRNANSRMVFRNPTLACQFLKEYVNLPIFQNLKPEDIKRIIRDVAWSLLMSMKVPEAEAQKMMEEMGVKGMGYLFENFSGIDIAGDRQRLAEARQELADARKEAEKAQREAVEAQKKEAEAQREAAEAQKEAVEAQREAADAIENFVRYHLSMSTGRKEIEILLQKIFRKEENEAVSILDQLIS